MKASRAIEPQCPLLAMAKAARLTFWKWIFSFCLFCHHSEPSYLESLKAKKASCTLLGQQMRHCTVTVNTGSTGKAPSKPGRVLQTAR